jgi:hypothetical protein
MSRTLTFAHSGTVIHNKGGNILVISHLESSLRVCGYRARVKLLFQARVPVVL